MLMISVMTCDSSGFDSNSESGALCVCCVRRTHGRVLGLLEALHVLVSPRPWLPLVGADMREVLPAGCRDCAAVLQTCAPQDSSACAGHLTDQI